MNDPANPLVINVGPGQRAALYELARDGAPNPVIAYRLGITTAAVAQRISQALAKTGYSDRCQLAVALIRGRLKLRLVRGGQ